MNRLLFLLLPAMILLFGELTVSAGPTGRKDNKSQGDTLFSGKITGSILPDSLLYHTDSLNTVSHSESITEAPVLFTGIPELYNFVVPSPGRVISRYGIRRGRMHTGTDIRLQHGDTVSSAYNGVIVRAKSYYGYGLVVIIDHQNGLETWYAHLSSFLVKEGDTVRTAQPVGLGGRTGRATTEHLHFEVREKNKTYDPELVFNFDEGTVRPEVINITSLAELVTGSEEIPPVKELIFPADYVIKAGDSLWLIARKFGTTVNHLCHLNQLTPSSVLQIGRILRISDSR